MNIKEHGKVYYKHAESLIKEYPLLNAALDDEEKQFKIIAHENGIRGIRYDKLSVKARNISDTTAAFALDNIKRKDQLKKQKEYFKLKIGRLDWVFKNLDEREEQVIRRFYIDGDNWSSISCDLQYSETQLKRIRTEGIKKLAFVLFHGLEDDKLKFNYQ